MHSGIPQIPVDASASGNGAQQTPNTFQKELPNALPEKASESSQDAGSDQQVDSAKSHSENLMTVSASDSAENASSFNSHQALDLLTENEQKSGAEVLPDSCAVSASQAENKNSSLLETDPSSAGQSSSLSSSSAPGQSASSVSSGLSSGKELF